MPHVVMPAEGVSLKEVTAAYERQWIESALEAAGGVQKRAAELLRIKPTTLNEMIKRYDIRPRRKKASPVRSRSRVSPPRPRARRTATSWSRSAPKRIARRARAEPGACCTRNVRCVSISFDMVEAGIATHRASVAEPAVVTRALLKAASRLGVPRRP